MVFILRFVMITSFSFGLLLLAFQGHAKAYSEKETLGQLLYFDTKLSKNRSQACATCHDPAHGFVDPRDNGVDGMVSLGDDGESLGDRHAPSAAYASFSPPFHKTKDGLFKGGQFHDGRASVLSDQAAGPPLNPIEMGMPSKSAILERLLEDDDYVMLFEEIYGKDSLKNADKAYDYMTDAIAAFEKTEEFAPFSSKYDRFLRGEAKLTDQEELGRLLFFSKQFTNCNECHQLHSIPGSQGETFTDYSFHNIGVPVNQRVRQKTKADTDMGLFANNKVNDPAFKGAFKTPTLRNVAITGPYMHNGVFRDLETVIRFYNQYNSKSDAAKINPETGLKWAEAEIQDTVALDLLQKGDALSEKRIKALVAFLKTLTDERYEALLKP